MENKPVDLRTRRTYKLLSEALIKLMKKKKFEKITVKDICDEALIHRTTFYSHFEDKYDLLKYCMSELELPFKEVEPEENYHDFYFKLARTVAEHIDENSDFFKMLIKKNKEESFITRFQDEFTKRLKEVILKQLDGKSDDVPVDFMASFYSGACMSVITWWLINNKPVSIEEMTVYFGMMLRKIDTKTAKEDI